MPPSALPVPCRILLVGAGAAHLEVLRRFGSGGSGGAAVTLLTPERSAIYPDMLPRVLAGECEPAEAAVDIEALARWADVDVHIDRAVGLDLADHLVRCARGTSLPFDLLSLDVSAETDRSSVPGAELAIALQPIDDFLPRIEQVSRKVLADADGTRVAVVGAGRGGVELVLAMARGLRRDLAVQGLSPSRLAISLLAGARGLLPGLPTRFREKIRNTLAEQGIELIERDRVRQVEPGLQLRTDDAVIRADVVIWATAPQAPSWLGEAGLAVAADGRVRVGGDLRALGRTDVFAAGDTMEIASRSAAETVDPMRVGTVIARNIERAIAGRKMVSLGQRSQRMILLGQESERAIGTLGGITVAGRLAWRLKTMRSQHFIDRYRVRKSSSGQ